MKKIFLSLLFLLLISISSNASAQSSGTCSGSPATCASRGSATACTGNSAGTGSALGCTWNGTACSGGTPTACASLTTQSLCSVSGSGCQFTVSANANENAFVDTMCNALKIVTGSGGKAFAAFAIISVGIGFFTGKISWGLMIGVTAGIAAMFGAPTIVSAISGDDAVDCGS